MCNFVGTTQVRYGASPLYNTGTFTSSVNCVNGVFGDPFPGADKTCEYATLVYPTPTPTPAPGANVIQLENAKTAINGVTSNWAIPESTYATNHEIEGYASATSVARGGSINFFVNTSDPTYTINIYRVGWYGGAGGRLVAGPFAKTRIAQAACPVVDTATALLECNWTVSLTLAVPNNTSDATDWASGNYLVKLSGSSGKQSYIPFVVRDDSRSAALMMQASYTTYQAYNNWGGKSLYGFSSGGVPANKVSFNRPYENSYGSQGAGQFFAYELRMVRFLEREGYDVVYSTNIDTHTNGAALLNYKGFLSVGHDEYWTKQMRDSIEAARNAKVNLGFFGANTGYWQIRLEPSIASGQANRTMVGYKDAASDPLAATNPAETTVKFRDVPVDRPEAALVGVAFDFDPGNGDMVISNCVAWICNGTSLVTGSVLPGMLGYEVDRMEPLLSPANIQVITNSPYIFVDDFGVTSTHYSNMTYYQAASGAGVFAVGSMNWNFGLDAYLINLGLVNPAVQQITRNVLNAFIAPPVTSNVSVEQADRASVSAASPQPVVGAGCSLQSGAQKDYDISLLLLMAGGALWRRRSRVPVRKL